MKNIVLSAGGTGGHIFPALAVAEELKSRFPHSNILFIGGNKGNERTLATQTGLRFVGLPVKGVLGKGFRSLSTISWVLPSLIRCWVLFRSFKPDIVLGFGSYAGFIPVLVACWKKIPTAIHEQNIYPGMSNRILGKKVDKIFLSFPDEKMIFEPSKIVVTGNPVRKKLVDIGQSDDYFPQHPKGRVLIVGGSQGARAINDSILKVLPLFRSQGISLMHQTGEADYERIRQGYRENGMDYEQVYPFIQDIAEAYKWSELVICRAGASTITELTVVGRPSILIPFPYAIHEHQQTNAKMLEKYGAAIVLEQSYLPEVNLAQIVGDLVSVPGKLKDMSQRALSLARPYSAKYIVQEMQKLVQLREAGF